MGYQDIYLLDDIILFSYYLPFIPSVPNLAPDQVTAYNTSSTSLKVKWTRLEEESFQGKPIGYKIVYYPDYLESDVNFVTVYFVSNTTTLTNLTVYTMYVINVSAVSSGGIGPANTARARTDAGGISVRLTFRR